MSRRYIFPAALGGVLFLGALLMYLFAGVQVDDFCYLHQFIGTTPGDVSFNYCEGPLIETPAQVISSFRLHYFYWGNARLGTLIIFAANLWPRWLTAALDAAALTAMFMLLMRLGLGRSWWRRPLACMGVAALCWWVFPWHEMMLSSAFAINYVWTAAMMLWLMLLLQTGRGSTWAVSLLALATAMMHEGLAVSADIYLLCLCLRTLIRRGWQTHLMLPSLLFAAGSLVVILNPAVMFRSGGGGVLMHGVWLPTALHAFFVTGWFIALSLLLPLLSRLWMSGRVWRRYLHFSWPLLAGSLAGAAVLVMVYSSALRSAWLALAFSMIVTLRGIDRIPLRFSAAVSRTAGWVLLACMGVWLGAVAMVQRGYSRERDRIMEQYMQNPQMPLIFSSMPVRAGVPWWTLGLPMTADISQFMLGHHYLNSYATRPYSRTERRRLTPIFLDPSLRGVRLDSLPRVPGGAGLRRCGRIYVSDSDFLKHCPERIEHKVYISYGTAADPSYGSRLPWYALWQRLRGGELSTYTLLMTYRVTVTEQMRRAGMAGADTDTLWFYVPEVFHLPRAVHGLPVTRMD